MPTKPSKNESQSAFMSRCIGVEVGNGHPQAQAVAMCASMWANHGKALEAEKACAKPGKKKPKKKK